MAGRGDKRGAGQNPARIKSNRFAFFEEIVIRISIDQRSDVRNDEAFFTIRDINVGVEKTEPLLFVFWNVQSPGIQRERARQRDAGCIFRVDTRALAKWRDWRADDAFRKSFLVDVGDVEDFKASRAVRGVEIFAAQYNVLNIVPAMFVCFGKKRATVDMFRVVGWVGDLVEMTADNCLRFIRLGPNDRVQSVMSFADIRVASKEIHCARAES